MDQQNKNRSGSAEYPRHLKSVYVSVNRQFRCTAMYSKKPDQILLYSQTGLTQDTFFYYVGNKILH